jgi:hypothetical protein
MRCAALPGTRCSQIVEIDSKLTGSNLGAATIRGRPRVPRVRSGGGETTMSTPTVVLWQGDPAASGKSYLDTVTGDVTTDKTARWGKPSREGSSLWAQLVGVGQLSPMNAPRQGANPGVQLPVVDTLELVGAEPPFDVPFLRRWGDCPFIEIVCDLDIPRRAFLPGGFARFRKTDEGSARARSLVLSGLLLGIAGSAVVTVADRGLTRSSDTSSVRCDAEANRTPPADNLGLIDDPERSAERAQQKGSGEMDDQRVQPPSPMAATPDAPNLDGPNSST